MKELTKKQEKLISHFLKKDERTGYYGSYSEEDGIVLHADRKSYFGFNSPRVYFRNQTLQARFVFKFIEEEEFYEIRAVVKIAKNDTQESVTKKILDKIEDCAVGYICEYCHDTHQFLETDDILFDYDQSRINLLKAFYEYVDFVSAQFYQNLRKVSEVY